MKSLKTTKKSRDSLDAPVENISFIGKILKKRKCAAFIA
jgi:hypothetical protein